MEERMTKYEIDVGEEFPLAARLAREFEARTRGFMGKVFIGGLAFVSLAAIAVGHPVATLAALVVFVALGKAHHHHRHGHGMHQARHGYYGRYWQRGYFDEDFL
jgi:hypothetical protein